MTMSKTGLGLALALVVGTAPPASALTMKECGEKYQAAKAGGTLKAKTWNAYRKAECGDEDVTLAEAVAAEKAAANTETSAKPAKAGRVVYPREVAPKYADESPARRGCTHASTSTMPTRPRVRTASSNGSRRAAAISASATRG